MPSPRDPNSEFTKDLMEPHRETRNEQAVRRLSVIDSHTCGEPTRVIVDGVPDLGAGTVAQRRQRLLHEVGEFAPRTGVRAGAGEDGPPADAGLAPSEIQVISAGARAPTA